MRRISVCLLGWLAISFNASASFTDLGSSMEGSAKNVPLVRMCANAALVAFHIADFFDGYYWSRDAHLDYGTTDSSGKPTTHRAEKFLSGKRKLENEIEKSDLPLAQKSKLQGFLVVQWNVTANYRSSPSDLASNYYLQCMAVAYK
jgi:hypothetical protein